MCVGCKELSGWRLDVYTAALERLQDHGLTSALVFLGQMEQAGPRGSGVYDLVAPMLREHAA
jgi:hypothetical protein